METKFEYPLQWPEQQPRTKRPERSRFEPRSPSRAGDELAHELSLLGAKQPVISTNLMQRKHGDGFYANQNVEDAAVAVYFQLKGSPKVMACDKWKRPEDNLRALTLSISAIRGLDRWGGSEFLDGLFEGFKALPPPSHESIVLLPQYFQDVESREQLKERYRNLARELHPDAGGSDEDFSELRRQYEEAKNKLGGA